MRFADDHRPILCRLVDDQDFQDLSPSAQRLWFFLRVSPECGPTGLFRFYGSLHRERLRMSEDEFAEALAELQGGNRWVILEGGYILLRNAMRWEPAFMPAKDPKHLVHVHRALQGLHHLSIAHYLLDSNGLSHPETWPSEAPPSPSQGPTDGPSNGPSDGPPKALGSTAPAPLLAPLPAPATAPAPAREAVNPTPEKGSSRSADTETGLAAQFEKLKAGYPLERLGDLTAARLEWAKLDDESRARALAAMPRFLAYQRLSGTALRYYKLLQNWIAERVYEREIPQLPDEVCPRCNGSKQPDEVWCSKCAAEVDGEQIAPPDYPPDDEEAPREAAH